MCESLNNISSEGVSSLFHLLTQGDLVESPLDWQSELHPNDFDLSLNNPFWNQVNQCDLDLPILSALIEDTSAQAFPDWKGVDLQNLDELLALPTLSNTLDVHAEVASHTREEREATSLSTHFKENEMETHRSLAQGEEALPRRAHTSKTLDSKTCLKPNKGSLMKKLPEALPNVKGYMGSPHALKRDAKGIQKGAPCSSNTLGFHKDYLVSRVRAVPSLNASRLFKEIKNRGYRRSRYNLEKLLIQMRQEQCTKGTLEFHQDYLLKRLKEIEPNSTLASKLFQEIRGRGYQDTLGKVKRWLRVTQKREGIAKDAFPATPDSHSNPDNAADQGIELEMQPDKGSISALAQNIKAGGEKQERSWGNMQKSVITACQEKAKSRKTPSSAERLNFYKDYLADQVKKHPLDRVSAAQLFREIKKKGYRMGLRQVQQFVLKVRKKNGLIKHLPPEESFGFHKNYLIGRITHNGPNLLYTRELFKEVQKRGYRGDFLNFRKSMTKLRKSTFPPQAFLKFHKDYVKKRIEESRPFPIPGPTLLKEIQNRGYEGTLNNLQKLVTRIRKSAFPPQALLKFHEDYLKKRIEESRPFPISGPTLLKEIQNRGYEGTLNNLQKLIVKIRKNILPPRALLKFHEDYLKKRIEESRPSLISKPTLFKEIQSRGYEGTLTTLRILVTKIRKNILPPQAFLKFHQDYLKKRIEESRPSPMLGDTLFKEIQNRGYEGEMQSVKKFVTVMRRQEWITQTETSL